MTAKAAFNTDEWNLLRGIVPRWRVAAAKDGGRSERVSSRSAIAGNVV